ncbi:MAG: acyl-CoA thioesterase [Verrucomicrobia bacterium]|nr:MAG: acyl-CoA thioesterase [Verrucomicrobiota bacterium]
MLRGTTEIRVRYAETDMMGIAYHGSYLPWLEIGRTELLRAHGLPYAELERLGYRLPVIDVALKYLRPALYDDVIRIESTMREKPLVRLRIDYELFRGETLIARGHTSHAFLDRENQPIRPPAVFMDAVKRWFAGNAG